jgi:hypothetical protein
MSLEIPVDILEPCDVHSNCLECPLPACKYDDRAGYLQWCRERILEENNQAGLCYYKGTAIAEIAERDNIPLTHLRWLIAAGEVRINSIDRLMTALNVNQRTIYRRIERGEIQCLPADQCPPIVLTEQQKSRIKGMRIHPPKKQKKAA